VIVVQHLHIKSSILLYYHIIIIINIIPLTIWRWGRGGKENAGGDRGDEEVEEEEEEEERHSIYKYTNI